MVHRPADSRLLGNLLSQEKEYAKHLATLLDHSNASLASVTAYGSASSPASAHLILAVAGSLAAADDALRHYAAAVDRWRDYLKGLKALEDEVGNIMRDREILVTRLIKASKPALHTSQSSGSLPLTSSPNQSQASLPFSANTPTNAKLVAAQTELQACEAHLAAKEAELDIRRAALVRDGLAGRCRALAECGTRWKEAGHAGALSAQGGSSLPAPSTPNSNKPLPGVSGSDVSLAPSQSASQINLYIDTSAPLPPPPSSLDHQHQMMLPPVDLVPVISSPSSKFAPHVLARRITEENLNQDDGEGSSVAEEEEEQALEVVENPRFASTTKLPNASSSKAGGLLKRNTTSKPTGALHRNSTYGSSTISVPVKTNSGFFGSIRGLFTRRSPNGGGSDVGPASRLKRAKRDVAESDDEPDIRSEPPTPVAGPRKRVVSDIGSQRRRRGLTDDDHVGIRRAEEWVGGQGALVLPRRAEADPGEDDKGWASDGGGTVKRRKSKINGSGTVRSVESAATSMSDTSTEMQIVISPKQKRRSSLGVSGASTADALVPPTTASATTRAEKRSSLPVHPAPRSVSDAPSLMSIVEGVSRANRTGWAAYNGVGLGSSTTPTTTASGLVEAKAPRLNVSVSSTESRGRTTSSATIIPIDGLPRAPASIFSTPAVPSTFAGPEMVAGPSSSRSSSMKLPAKSPLRSALRNSATPSPPASQVQPVAIVAPVAIRPTPVPIHMLVPSPPPIIVNGKGKEKEVEEEDFDDGASISSYATGIETFESDDKATDGEETETEREHSPPPPPPHDYSNHKVTNGVIHDSPIDHTLIEDFGRGASSDLSASTVSAEHPIAQAPQRRKSVRVSLQPTFSTTPPASPDDEDEANGEDHAPWNGRSQPRSSTPDMWEDSSEQIVA
ncbi:hypothetical protein MIND_01322000 [Mycena indigotica]|uniref:Uncharacterized protein n=1 Tax=Mycena indigotica TaxID=2126181 RepID=A0A8H6RZZ0_9AGAR|nr:uncharacterized protein MIND_01322000 [Mycena indigotica]KAF7290810.1 hypothetical protein MIND_01322000 [Mycena indigotica]